MWRDERADANIYNVYGVVLREEGSPDPNSNVDEPWDHSAM